MTDTTMGVALQFSDMLTKYNEAFSCFYNEYFSMSFEERQPDCKNDPSAVAGGIYDECLKEINELYFRSKGENGTTTSESVFGENILTLTALNQQVHHSYLVVTSDDCNRAMQDSAETEALGANGEVQEDFAA
ncbi:MAG: hypothetical protein RLN62_04335 [Rickettsiales bacterium]